MQPPSHDDVRAYYTAALAGLRFVEARRPTGRRFGPEADARWSGFRADLTTADRLDLLLRDADTEWRSAFGARAVFAESAVAEDQAFGPAWPGLEPVDAEDLWRAGLSGQEPRDLDALLSAWSRAWGATFSTVDLRALTDVDRLVVVGPSAIAAALRAFVGRDPRAWTEQITIVATPPSHRQLASLATAVLNATEPAPLFTHGQAHSLVGRVLLGPDATAEDAAAARASAS